MLERTRRAAQKLGMRRGEEIVVAKWGGDMFVGYWFPQWERGLPVRRVREFWRRLPD